MPGAFEEFDVEAPPADCARRPPRPLRPARSAVGYFLVGLILVAAGVLVAPNPATNQYGIADHLDTPPQLLWEVPLQSSHPSAGRVWIGSDEVVAVGSNSVHAVDLATGEVIWDVRAPQLRCAREEQDIACVSRQGARAELIELTMAGGEVGRTVHTGLVAALPHDGGLIAIFDQSGSLGVMRQDDAGEHLWSLQVDAADADLEGIEAAAVEDLVLIQAPREHDTPVWHVLNLADGEVRSEINALSGGQGDWLVQRDDGITWYDSSGRVATRTAHGALLRVDDDPDSDLVFSGQGGALRALSGDDGTEVWQHPASGTETVPQARLAEVIVGWAEGTWYGLDISDGSLQWTTPGTFPRCPCLGSGTVLASVTGQTDSVLTGIDVTTGAQQWQVPLSQSSAFSYDATGAHLAVFSVYGLSAWSLQE